MEKNMGCGVHGRGVGGVTYRDMTWLLRVGMMQGERMKESGMINKSLLALNTLVSQLNKGVCGTQQPSEQ
jgi:hypothetical protein